MPNIPDADLELPAYSAHVNPRADPQVAHSFRLMKDNHPTLTVVLSSRAETADSTPVLNQMQTLAGTITLDLSEGLHVRSVTVEVIGEIRKVYAIHRFLTMRRELYTVETGGHHESLPTETADSPPRGKARLTGRHSWSYSLKLPKGVSIPWDGGSRNFRLPPTFADTRNSFTIDYHLLVRVKTGFLSSGYRLACPFLYVLRQKPSLPSLLHQIAKLQGLAIPGPEEDSDGWRTLPSVEMTGMLFSSRLVAVTCKLSIPLPLCYTRGTTVPIHLVLKSTDGQALDLLCSHALRVVLIRTISYTERDAKYAAIGVGVYGPEESHADEMAFPQFTVVSGEGGNPATSSRVLRGTLAVPEDLVPGFRILNYTIEYSIAIYPFEAAGFSPSAPRGNLSFSLTFRLPR
ncbi:hypothetical protein BC835DRAFT_1410494 [Cytidiella melzeri]|nr:hypothetical protein BC835DRAFT_1410494 [Cytidiella melzeri]